MVFSLVKAIHLQVWIMNFLLYAHEGLKVKKGEILTRKTDKRVFTVIS